MVFRVTNIAQCPAAEHLTLTVQINGGAAVEGRTSFDELRTAGDTLSTAERGLMRLKSAILEADAQTKLQMRNAVLNIDFEI